MAKCPHGLVAHGAAPVCAGADTLVSMLSIWEQTRSSATAFLGAPHTGCYLNTEWVIGWGRGCVGKQGPSVARAVGLLVLHNEGLQGDAGDVV